MLWDGVGGVRDIKLIVLVAFHLLEAPLMAFTLEYMDS